MKFAAMWPESYSVKAVSLVTKSVVITEIMNFSKWIVILLMCLYL